MSEGMPNPALYEELRKTEESKVDAAIESPEDIDTIIQDLQAAGQNTEGKDSDTLKTMHAYLKQNPESN